MELKNSTPEHFYNQLRKHRKYLPEWSALSLTEKKAVASRLRNVECLLGDIYREHKFPVKPTPGNLCLEIPLPRSSFFITRFR